MTFNLRSAALLPAALFITVINAASAQESPPPAPVADGEASALDETDDLDSLLELAETDVAGLTQVKVMAPALQEVVSTVSRQKSTVGRSPAAVFVITNEMIRRSGARSIPEALRMAPGVNVAKIDSSKWAVSIRGFNSRFANKLLVQIDGRSVYTPLFAGVFWDVQDVLLEDVERIEVIRGPGATVWGANAVNGVINVITKNAKATQGTFIEAGGGTERAYSSVRHGGALGNDAHYRAYGKWFERDSGWSATNNANDDWRMGRGGFRLDWTPDCCDTITFQGDIYDGYTGREQTLAAPFPALAQVHKHDAHVSGGNFLFRFNREIDNDTDWSLQLYYDRTERHFRATGFEQDLDIIDVDFQHRSSPFVDHSIIWGLGYRFHDDRFQSAPFFIGLNPADRKFDRASVFVQDEMNLVDDQLSFTVGTKVSHNDFSGTEVQPSARLLWTPTQRHSIWASVSRAVRTPSRADYDSRITFAPSLPGGFPPPVYPVVFGSPSFESEVLHAYELGIRQQVTQQFSWDFAAFFQDYDELRSNSALPITISAPEGVIAPFLINNNGRAQIYGFELAARYEVSDCWQLFGNYSFSRANVDGALDQNLSPRNQLYIQSSWSLTRDLDLDLIGRYADNIGGERGIPKYVTADIRLGWQASDSMEVFVVGRNMLDQMHPEFSGDIYTGTPATQARREVYGGFSLHY